MSPSAGARQGAELLKCWRVELWEPEDKERASLIGCVLKVRHRPHEPECGRLVPRVEICRDDHSRPAPDAGQNGHILLAVRTTIGRRLADYPRPGLELPEHRAGPRIDSLEPAVHRSIEGEAPGGGHRAAPNRKRFFDRPDFLSRFDVPRRVFSP